MSSRRWWEVLALVVVGGMVAVSVSAAPATVTLDAPESVEPGDTVTISTTLTNTGDSGSEYILDISGIPEGWEIENRTDDGGEWKSTGIKWLYLSIDADESVEPSLTFSVPEDADTTTLELTAEVKDSDGVRDEASQTIAVGGASSGGDADSADTGQQTSATGEQSGLGIVPIAGIVLVTALIAGLALVVLRR